MLQVSPDGFVAAGSCAAASWFISINPVMSVVIKTQSRIRFFLSSKPSPVQNEREF